MDKTVLIKKKCKQRSYVLLNFFYSNANWIEDDGLPSDDTLANFTLESFNRKFQFEIKYDSLITLSNRSNNENGNFCDGTRNLAAGIAKNEC